MGDGVLVYFGYPEAHEADAANAVRAALAMIEAIGALKVGAARHQVRIGIATGLVVVGELVGAGEAQERNVVGETPNLAARLQSVAAPNSVLIAASTRRLTGDLFEYEPVDPGALKGFDGPVAAWRVLREQSMQSRFESLREANQVPLVGREEELDLLMRRWNQAKSGRGPRRAAVRRAGHRQVAPDRGLDRPRRGRSRGLPALFLSAASPGQRVAADRRADCACRGLRARRFAGAQARQTGKALCPGERGCRRNG